MTDGLSESFNEKGEMLGYDRVSQLVMEAVQKSPQDIIDHLQAASSNWLNGSSQNDDMTFFVFKRKLRQEAYDTRMPNVTKVSLNEEMESFLQE